MYSTIVIIDMKTSEIVARDWNEYDGPVMHLGGGPSSEQKQAAASQAAATDQSLAAGKDALQFQKDQIAKITPFATNRLNNGLPFYGDLTDYAGGTSAKAWAPAKAAALRSLDSTSSFYGTPSGYRNATLGDIDASRARDFDSSLTDTMLQNEQSKQQAAGLLTGQAQLVNPQSWYGTGMQGNQSILQAPLQSPGLGGLIGGIAGGAISKIPF